MAFQRVQFQKFPVVGPAPRAPWKFVPSALMFEPTALTSACFTHESGTLKCYRKPCDYCIIANTFRGHSVIVVYQQQ